MGEMGFRQRLVMYLYSTPHIVGSLFALAGLGLYFVGVIGPYWLAIVLGLYGAGVLLTPRSRGVELRLSRELDAEAIRRALDKLLHDIRGQVGEVLYQRVESIVQSIQAVLPRLAQLHHAGPAAYTVREMALSYLPETLGNYLRLPRAYARFHHVRDGKTPRELLLEQLALLDSEMQRVVEDIHREDVSSIEAHGRFLRSRFAQSDDFLKKT